jgi:hypothetical protein
MDPISAAIGITAAELSTGLGAAGAAVGAAGTIGAGISARNQANYQAQVSKNNQKVAEQNAQYATQAGEAQTEAAGQRARAREAAITTGIAAAGLDVNSGSAREIRSGEAATGELEQLTTAQSAALRAYGYQSQGTGFAAEAGLEQNAADAAVPGAVLSAGGSLLSSAAQLPSKYRWMVPGSGVGSNPGSGTGGLY